MTGSRTADEELRLGLSQLWSHEYFEAHETFELCWRAAGHVDRDFFQGLVHVSVAWYQAGRGNRVGCGRQLEKAARRLGPYAPRHRNVDVAAVLDQVGQAQATLAAGSLHLPPLRDPGSEG